jgi:urease accessory protein
LCALFGLAHGMAHGAEMPQDANGLLYALGFLSATGLLHACGLVMGLKANPLIGKVAGYGLVVIGAGLLVGSL